MGIPYYPLEELLPMCDIVTLHCPLLPSTYHLMDARR
jgi:D-lactate dehydrogenase